MFIFFLSIFQLFVYFLKSYGTCTYSSLVCQRRTRNFLVNVVAPPTTTTTTGARHATVCTDPSASSLYGHSSPTSIGGCQPIYLRPLFITCSISGTLTIIVIVIVTITIRDLPTICPLSDFFNQCRGASSIRAATTPTPSACILPSLRACPRRRRRRTGRRRPPASARHNPHPHAILPH